MASTYTTNLGLTLPTTGELSGVWGSTVNTGVTELLDSSIAGTTTLSADADVTLSVTDGAANQARSAVILWTASNGATPRNITVPSHTKAYIVINAGTGSIVVKGAATTGVTIATGVKALIAWNGSDFVRISSSAVALTDITGLGTGVATALAIAVGSAGAPVVLNGAGGTPSSINLTNATAYPGTSALTTVGALNSGSITSGFGAIDVGTDAISGGAISGTGIIKVTGSSFYATQASPVDTLIISNLTSGQARIYTNADVPIVIGVNGGDNLVVTSTGLAVTGALSATNAAGNNSCTITGTNEAQLFLNKSTATAQSWKIYNNGNLVFYDDTGAKIPLYLTPTSAIVAGLLDLSASTAGQIKFPATQNASADANTLDDYEEGTWTAILSGTTGDPTTPVTSTAYYIKIGAACVVDSRFSNRDTTGASGKVYIAGLPFVVSNTTESIGSCMMAGFGTAPAVTVVRPNTTYIDLYGSVTVGTINMVAAAGIYLYASVTYRT